MAIKSVVRSEFINSDKVQLEIDQYSLRDGVVKHVQTIYEDSQYTQAMIDLLGFMESEAPNESLFLNGKCVQQGLLSTAQVAELEESWSAQQLHQKEHKDRVINVSLDVAVLNQNGRIYSHSSGSAYTYEELSVFLDDMADTKNWAVFLNGKCIQQGNLSQSQIKLIEKSFR